MAHTKRIYTFYDHDEIKASLLEMAKTGKPRPKQKDGVEGRSLSKYTSKKNSAYDAALDKQLRKLRPDWFPRTGWKATENKALILREAKKGTDRTDLPYAVNMGLGKYASDISPSFDPMFAREIRALRPDWFNGERIREQRKTLLALAKDGGERPYYYSRFTAVSGPHYEAAFAEKLKRLRPDWFITPNEQVGLDNKARLIQLAMNGEPKPSGKRDANLYRIWRLYSHDKPDAEFIKIIKKVAPHWFHLYGPRRHNYDELKARLLELAREGSPRPKVAGSIEGRYLTKFTSKKSRYYDSAFESELINLRPDWFLHRNA